LLIDYKGAKVSYDMFKNIDWTRENDFKTEPFLSEDILTLEYDTCIIDLGWYGGKDGHFSIFIVIPENEPDENGCYYTPESWDFPFARIPCKDQSDMLTQLQRAIDIYPEHLKEKTNGK
jgi:hypothetical protein